MIRFSHAALIGAVAAVLMACGPRPPPVPSQTDHPGSNAEHLMQIVEGYWDDHARMMPWYSWGGADLDFGATPGGDIAPQALADSLALERRYLEQISSVPRSSLDAGSQLTYDMFRRERAAAIEGFTYPFELLPINPYAGMPQQFAAMAPAAERLALSSGKEFESWRSRTDSFVQWMNQAIVNLRDGLRRGYTLPRLLVERMLPQLAALGEDTSANLFYQAIRSDADGKAAARLTPAVTAVIRGKITPSYRALHEFLQREYLPRARQSVALSALPLGEAWYAYLARRATGSAVTPAQLHSLGEAEIERLRQRTQALLADTPFAGDAQGFVSQMLHDPRFSYAAADRSTAIQGLKGQVAAAAPALFSSFPRVDFDIRDVEAYREATMPPLSYKPRAPNGFVGAVLYVDAATFDSRPVIGLIAQFLREAVPGHHYQLEIQRERADLPRFRRFNTAPAFVEGWGLYAATLGGELDLYHDAEAKFASLLAETQCAAGLVIDTGLHAQGWTRTQALDYLHAKMPIEEAAADNMVDRIIALPGEALACTVGFLKIQGLRAMAQQKLGARFDLRAFHAEIVKDGAMPLDLLEGKLKAWTDRVPTDDARTATPAASAVPGPDQPPAPPGGDPR